MVIVVTFSGVIALKCSGVCGRTEVELGLFLSFSLNKLYES